MTMTDTPPPGSGTRPRDPQGRRILGLPRRWFVAAVAALAVLVVAAIVWFEPQALFLDDRVDEDFPAAANVDDAPAGGAVDDGDSATSGDAQTGTDTAPQDTDDPVAAGEDTAVDEAAADGDADDGAAGDGAAAADAGSAGPVLLGSGEFTGRNDYAAVGTASTFEVDGRQVLRFEDLEVDNGPDLVVWLTSADADADDGTIRGDFVELGELKGNIGNQNYDVPDDVDLGEYDTVVIWCRRFTVGFATAALT